MPVSAAAILVCALDVLGRSASTLPPIELVASPPAGVSANAEAFVRPGTGTISLVTSARSFTEASCRRRRSLVKLASIIVHEEWHVRQGGNEKAAYEVQLMTLMRLGAGPDSMEYRGVRRAMAVVLAREEQARRNVPRLEFVLARWF